MRVILDVHCVYVLVPTFSRYECLSPRDRCRKMATFYLATGKTEPIHFCDGKVSFNTTLSR